jgi:hypothetical protein
MNKQKPKPTNQPNKPKKKTKEKGGKTPGSGTMEFQS